jgi:Cys-tRNA(Pro)/Cys-tRNA(Cys) deacylase
MTKGATAAIDACHRVGVCVEVLTYDLPRDADSYGEAVSAALGLDAQQVFKTLVLRADDRFVIAVVPVTGTCSLKAVGSALGAKRTEMARPVDAERLSGSVVGGISPLGFKVALATVIDETVVLFDRVYVSGGKRGIELGLAPDDLVALTGATLAAIAR